MSPTLAALQLTAIIGTLRSCPLFAGMSPAEIKSIAAITTVRPVAKGEYLFHEGDASTGFYLVQTGAINVHRVNAAGRERVIHVFRAGESFAEAALATEKGYPADARALEPSQVLQVQKDGMFELIRHQPELALRMLSSMSSHLRILVAQLDDLTLKDVETRFAHWIIKRCPQPPGPEPVTIRLPMAKRVLAAELGTVSETFSRTLAKFRDQGLIAVEDKTVTVLAPLRLSALLRKNLGE